MVYSEKLLNEQIYVMWYSIFIVKIVIILKYSKMY